jgi:hypothetical protein
MQSIINVEHNGSYMGAVYAMLAEFPDYRFIVINGGIEKIIGLRYHKVKTN